MDWKQAWSKTVDSTNSTLDSIAPTFVGFAQRWDVEADRRNKLRTPENLKALIEAQRENTSARSTYATAATQHRAAKAASNNPFNGARRAARTADKAAKAHAKVARANLKAARRNYPDTLARFVAKLHGIHAVPAVGYSAYEWLHSGAIEVLPPFLSAAFVAAIPAGLWLGHRQVTPQFEDGLSAEERRLMERLDPSYWVQHADSRGLSGTLTERPEITPAGIVCGVRLDGKGWSAKKLAGEADAVRALLGMKTETRMQISRGSHGDRALIVIRTRSASDGVSMIWTPDHVGIGVDEVSGEFVDLPLKPGTHVLLAGITGMGKSVSWRPLVMRAHLDEEWTAVVVDPKRQEAIGWQHCLRCVGQEQNREKRMADIYAVAKELTREMHRRQGIATGPVWVPDGKPENRQLLVVIDEGAAIVRMAKQKPFADVMDLFEELWSEARSVGFQFVWATQFPTKSVGVPAAVKENMSARLSLTVGAGEAERAIFGETAQQEGWLPSRLDGIPGRAMLQFGKRKPDPLRLWHVTDGMVAGLPKEDPWFSPTSTEAPDQDGRRLTLVKAESAEAPAPREVEAAKSETAGTAALTGAEAKVLAALLAASGPQRHRDLVEAAGMAKATVSKALTGLIGHGLVVRDGQTYAATEGAKEASA